MRTKIFVQKTCPNCPGAKELGMKLAEQQIEVDYHDIKTTEGLTEAVMHDVMSTPSVVILDDSGKEVHSWRGLAPGLDEFMEKMK